MDSREELSKDQKLLIVKHLKSGISQREVAQTLGCAQSSVCRTWKKYCSTNDTENLTRSDYPRATSSRQDMKLDDTFMVQDKKFTLIPEELVTKHTVSNKRLSELDKLMLKILNSDLPDQEKLTRYREMLQTSLNLQEFNRPIMKHLSTNETHSHQAKKDDEEITMDEKDNTKLKIEKKEDYRDFILAAMPKSKRDKAENILSFIHQQPDIFSYNERGEMSLHGLRISDSNIFDFLNYMLDSRKVIPRKNIFDKAVNDLNIPKSFISNKMLLHSAEEDVPKKINSELLKKLVKSKYNLRKEKPVIPFKWEKL